jgi:PPP family 3-phenylpropionic acid transporter
MSRRHHMFLLEGVYFISFCTLYAYTVTILLEYGYTEVQCGYITMLQYVMMTIAGPVYGRMIDRGLSPKKLFIILAAGGIIVTPLLPVCFAKGFSLTMISFGIISTLDFCGATVIDTWINQMTLRDETIDYGMIRSAGSIFYATTAIVSGYLIVPLGINFLFWLHMGSLAVAILLAVTFADPNKLPLLEPDRFAGEDAPDETFAQSIRTMMQNRPFVIFLICGTMYYFATRAVNGFMQVIINYIGGDASTYGVSVFLYCVGEFLLMRLASRLLRRGMKLPVLFITATVGLGLRILLLGVLKTMTGVMLTQILLSVGFASYLRFNIDYVASLFPRQYAGRAILISVAVTQGLGSIIGNLAGGYLLASVGVPVYCFICGGAMFLSMAIFLMGKPFSAAK